MTIALPGHTADQLNAQKQKEQYAEARAMAVANLRTQVAADIYGRLMHHEYQVAVARAHQEAQAEQHADDPCGIKGDHELPEERTIRERLNINFGATA
jgi:hypothetical protein